LPNRAKSLQADAQRFAAPVKAGYERDAYVAAIRRVQEYILAGDVYQVNLTQRFYANIGGASTWELYKRLMAINPAPFAGYLKFGETSILSASPRRSVIDLIRAAFPGGSITGAPKIRAMEIIEEHEPVRRGTFTGAIGYLGFNGASDLNIAIRTMLAQNGRAFVQVGGGIVADSVAEEEYEECLVKGRLLFEALERLRTAADER